MGEIMLGALVCSHPRCRGHLGLPASLLARYSLASDLLDGALGSCDPSRLTNVHVPPGSYAPPTLVPSPQDLLLTWGHA